MQWQALGCAVFDGADVARCNSPLHIVVRMARPGE